MGWIKARRVKIGDQVVLNSGGPVMEVRSIRPDGMLECTWDMQHDFNPVCVQKVEITKAG